MCVCQAVTGVNLIGYGIAFLGVCYYNYSKLQAMQAKQQEAAAAGTAQKDTEKGQAPETAPLLVRGSPARTKQ